MINTEQVILRNISNVLKNTDNDLFLNELNFNFNFHIALVNRSNILIFKYMDDFFIIKNRYYNRELDNIIFDSLRYEDIINLDTVELVDFIQLHKNIIIKYDILSKLICSNNNFDKNNFIKWR